MLITAAEAAEILGVTLQTVYDYATRGRVTRHAPSRVRHAYGHVEVEAYSLARIVRQHHAPHHYWATSEGAAEELGVTGSAVRQMMLSDRLPYETAANGRRYVRRHQLEVIANTRDSRLTEGALRGVGSQPGHTGPN